MQIRAVAFAGTPAQVQHEVARAMETGSVLVQASLEHLETAERFLGMASEPLSTLWWFILDYYKPPCSILSARSDVLR